MTAPRLRQQWLRRRLRLTLRRPSWPARSGCWQSAPFLVGGSRMRNALSAVAEARLRRRRHGLPSATRCWARAAAAPQETPSCCARRSRDAWPRSSRRSAPRTTKGRRSSTSCGPIASSCRRRCRRAMHHSSRAITGLAFEVPGRADPIELKPDHIHDAGVIDPKTRALPVQIEVENRTRPAARSDRPGPP